MIVALSVVHIVALVLIIALLRSLGGKIARPARLLDVIWILIVTILAIFFFHVVEIWTWAILYIWLGEFDTIERALYFSTVTYTALGYGDITLQQSWQLLSSFEAANGIMLFGVSTAFLISVLRKVFAMTAIIGPEH
jgi:hypothetical protein